jgi:hypothetical protein
VVEDRQLEYHAVGPWAPWSTVDPPSRHDSSAGLPELSAGDRRILTDDVRLYRPLKPVEYGTPLVGLVVF